MKWTAELQDKISGDAKAASSALEKLETDLHKIGDESDKVGKQSGDSMGHLALKVGFATEAFHLLAEGIKKGIEKGIEFGKFAVEAGEFKRQALIGFEAVLGSKKAAAETVEAAETLAVKSGAPLQQTVDQFQRLGAVGVKNTQSMRVLVAAAQDFAGMKLGSADQFIDSLTMIAGRGQLTGIALRQLTPIGKELAKVLGAASFKDLQKQLNDAPLAAQKAIPAIVKALELKSGGPVGKIGKEIGEGITGGINKVKNSIEVLLGSVADSPAITAIGSALAQVATAFNPATESGKSMQHSIERIAATAAELFTDIANHKQDIVRLFEFGANAAQKLLDIMEAIGRGMGKVGAFYGTLAGGGSLRDAGDAVNSLKQEEATPEDLKNVVFESKQEKALGAVPELPHAASGAMVDSDTVMHVGEGGDTELVSPEPMLREIVRSESNGGSTGGQVSITLQFGDIKIDGRGKSDDEIGQMIMERLRDEAPGAMLSAFERIGIQGS